MADLYVVIINETTYRFFDEKHFIIRFGDELSKYHYPISVEVEEGKDESICIFWVS